MPVVGPIPPTHEQVELHVAQMVTALTQHADRMDAKIDQLSSGVAELKSNQDQISEDIASLTLKVVLLSGSFHAQSGETLMHMVTAIRQKVDQL